MSFLPPADYPFVPTMDADEFIAVRAIFRLRHREGVWTAVLLDGSCSELDSDVAEAILNPGAVERAYLPSALFEPFAGAHGPARAHTGPHGPVEPRTGPPSFGETL